MRISNVTAHCIRIPFKTTFAHASHARSQAEPVILVMETETGEHGVGEVLPRSYLTGESVQDAIDCGIPNLADRWLGRTFEDCAQVEAALTQELPRMGRRLAAFAGWELALLDAAGKSFGFAVGDLLGPLLSKIESGVVIDFGVPTHGLERYCRLLRLTGKRQIKVKVGAADDLRRLDIIQETLGPAQQLRLDANGAWSADSAVENLKLMRRFNIHSIEQPVTARDLAGMRRVREATGIRVVADESLCTLDDAHEILSERAADIFNIRVAKCGGLFACKQIVSLAHNAGLSCQLGALVGETGILMRAAEILGQRVSGFEFLEGRDQNKHLLVEDVVSSAGSGAGGLGIQCWSSVISRLSVCDPIKFQAKTRSFA